MKRIFSASKIATAVVAASLLITSCKKDPVEPGPNNPTASKIKKVSGDNSEIEFGYNSAGKIQSVTVTDDFVTNGTQTKFTAAYGAGDKITELKADDQSRIIPQYTGNNITSAINKDASGATVYTATYTYENNHLKSATVETSFGFNLRFDFMPDATGNLTRSEVFIKNPITGQMESTGFTTHQFDSKANPLYENKSLLSLFLFPISKNNIVKEQEYDEQGVLTETKEYNYTYNDKNLPKSAILKTTPAGGASTNTNVSYQYQ